MPHDHHPPSDEPLDLRVERLLQDAYGARLDVETAARHLWAIDRAAAPARTSEAAAEPPAPPAPAMRRRLVGAGARTLVLALSFVTVLSTSGVAVAASASALPGELLYPVKLTTERVQLLVAFSPQRDARLHLKIARTRLAEASAVAVDRPSDVLSLLVAAVDAVERAERSQDANVRRDAAIVRRETGATLVSISDAVGPGAVSDLDEVAGRLGIAVAEGPEPMSADDGALAPSVPRDEGRGGPPDTAATPAPAPRPLPAAVPAPTPAPARASDSELASPEGPASGSDSAGSSSGGAAADPTPAPSPAPTRTEAPAPTSSPSPSPSPTPEPSQEPTEAPSERDPSTKHDPTRVGPGADRPSSTSDGAGSDPAPEPEPEPAPDDGAESRADAEKGPGLHSLADRFRGN